MGNTQAAHCSGSLLGMSSVSTLFEQHDFSAGANVSTTVLLVSEPYFEFSSPDPSPPKVKLEDEHWTWTVILVLFLLDMTDLRCVNAGNIRGNVSSNDRLVTARPILCQIVRFKSGFMTRRRAQNGAIPTFILTSMDIRKRYNFYTDSTRLTNGQFYL